MLHAQCRHIVQWEWQTAGGMSTGCPPDYSSPVNLTGIAFWFTVLPNLAEHLCTT